MDGEWYYCLPCYVEVRVSGSNVFAEVLDDEGGQWLTGHKRPKTAYSKPEINKDNDGWDVVNIR